MDAPSVVSAETLSGMDITGEEYTALWMDFQRKLYWIECVGAARICRDCSRNALMVFVECDN